MSHQDATPAASAATARPAAELPTDAKKGGDHLGNGWRHKQLQRSGQLLRKIEHMCARDLRHKMRVNKNRLLLSCTGGLYGDGRHVGRDGCCHRRRLNLKILLRVEPPDEPMRLTKPLCIVTTICEDQRRKPYESSGVIWFRRAGVCNLLIGSRPCWKPILCGRAACRWLLCCAKDPKSNLGSLNFRRGKRCSTTRNSLKIATGKKEGTMCAPLQHEVMPT